MILYYVDKVKKKKDWLKSITEIKFKEDHSKKSHTHTHTHLLIMEITDL